MPAEPTMKHERIQAAVEDALLAGDVGQLTPATFAHLKTCSACQTHYEALLAVEAHLEGSTHGLTERQIERVGARLLAGMTWRSAPVRRSWRTWWAAGSATAVLAAMALLVLFRVELHEEFQARGLVSAAAPAIRVRAYCLSVADGDALVRAVYPAPALTWRSLRNRCSVEDVLSFTYEASLTARPYVFVVAFDAERRPHWYHPVPDERQSIAMQRGGGELSLPGAVRLKTNHRPGRFAVVALVSDEPLTVEEVARAIATLGQDQMVDALAEKLGDNVEQQTFELSVEAEP